MYSTLRKGSSGDTVKLLQSLLKITVDGRFGSKTKLAVKAYQTANGLSSDGVVGPNTWAVLLGTGAVLGKRPPDNKQYDKRWGSVMYSSHGDRSQTIRSSACGPTSMTDIINAWFDTNVTPVNLCKLAVSNGFRTYNSGTSWNFYPFIAKRYAFGGYKPSNDEAEVIAALKKGALIVASMGPGYWTKAGHFICLWQFDGTYMYACDPASPSRKRQKLTKFRKEVKRYFIFYPPADLEGNDDPTDGTTPTTPTTPPTTPEPPPPVIDIFKAMYKPGKGVYDVSKWQGPIDWEKVAKSGMVALIILRAGYGQNTIDPRFVEYATACRKYGIPFAVYWYSYAEATAKETQEQRAENEADSFYRIASPFDPLFYCIDAEEARLTGASIDAFNRRIKEISGKKTGAYIANHRFRQYNANTALVNFVWIPKYDGAPPSHRPCDLHQTGGSRVPGIPGSVDTNEIPESGRYTLDYFLED